MNINGKEVVIDLGKITITEFRKINRGEAEEAEENAIIGKVCGLTADEIGSLPYPVWRELAAAFFEAARKPLENPT